MSNTDNQIHAIVHYEDDYVQPLILAALKARLPPEILVLLNSDSEIPSPNAKVLQWRQYEALNLDDASAHPATNLINAYIIRKALIRKHYLSTTVAHWLTKNPGSIVKSHVKPSVEFEVDYAEFLDDALVEAFELRESFEKNADLPESEREWWILKPGMSDRGQGIRLFSTEEELTEIFEQWEEELPDSDDEAEHSDDERSAAAGTSGAIMTSQLRHFVAQPYVHPPLLLPEPFSSAGRKFHIRTYVVAVGALKVYVYKPMLALFAAEPYTAPGTSESGDVNEELTAHLTNTCLQSGEREGSVHAFWSLPSEVCGLPARDWKEDVFTQICKVTGEVFEAAARSMSIHFQPLPNAFEIFGVDYLVDAEGQAWLLEINAFPDFKQTGDDLSGIIQGLFEDVVTVGVAPFFHLEGSDAASEGTESMVKALDIDLGRR
ncbi:hypothetical protein M8818_007723 [Zalaria obscura]|uniref:Uncharacterized protein n=1 Tax=Zalaria obscura TaxID=2024903 RepID=A0ACC3S2Q0_9PEZI